MSPARRTEVDQPPTHHATEEPEPATVAVDADVYAALVEGDRVQLDDNAFASVGVPVVDDRFEVTSIDDDEAMPVPARVVDLDAGSVLIEPA